MKDKRLTDREWKNCLEYFGDACAVCGRTAQPGLILVADHWIPMHHARHLENTPASIATNRVPLCHSTALGMRGCNQSKGINLPHDWLSERIDDSAAMLVENKIRAYFVSIDPNYVDLASWSADKKLYKPKEFAELLGISVRTLQRWDRDGVLVAGRTPGNRRVYTEEHLQLAMERIVVNHE